MGWYGFGLALMPTTTSCSASFARTVAASLQGRVALRPRAGQPVRRFRSAAVASPSCPPRSGCAQSAASARSASGSTRAPASETARWRCGPVVRPVAPTLPIR